MSALGLLNDWLLWLAGLIAAGLGSLGVPFVATYKRSKKNERRLIGDEDDPHNDGVLEIVADNNGKIEELERKMESQHRKVIQKIEDSD